MSKKLKNKGILKAPRKSQTRNPQETRARILEKAIGIFAASGFNGASVSDIIQSAGVNQRMLYHYFGDKKGLYRAIFLHVWGELKDWFDQALRKRMSEPETIPLDIRKLIALAASVFFDFMANHQTYVRLLMWEGLEGGEISRSIWTDVRGPLFVQIQFLVKQAQSEGLIDSHLDTSHFIVSFLGVISFYFAYAPTLQDMIGEDPLSPKALEMRKTQVLRLLENLYLKK